MFNYTVELKENGVWREELRWERPILDTTTLDESLDSGTMRLWLYGRKQRIEPFTPIRFKIYEVYIDTPDIMYMKEEDRAPYLKKVIYRISGDSTVEQKRFAYKMPGALEVFLHTIQTLEPTKLLERDICDTLTFTNKLGRNYLEGATKVNIVNTRQGGTELTLSVDGYYLSPMALNSVETVASARCLYDRGNTEKSDRDWHCSGGSIKVINPDGDSENVGICSSVVEDEGNGLGHDYHYYGVFSATKEITFTKNGVYQVVYTMILEKKFTDFGDAHQVEYEWTATITVIDGLVAPSYYTITKIINRILSAGVTRTKDAPQKYTLDLAIAEKFKDVQSPEFYIPHGTMWEALSAVGGYIHGIPRLIWNKETDKPDVVTFDLLDEAVNKDITARVAAYTETIKADSYCDSINSVVENVLNTRDRKQGTILDPCAGGFKSVRCDDTTIEIADDSAIITTALPIDTISKVLVKKVGDNSYKDITPYLFEAAEYDGVLSEYTSSYPHSKAWALRYEQGSNQITGLAFKLESVNSVDAAIKKPAIENILEAVGVTVPSHYKDLVFQIEYVPYINMRVVQKKTYGTGKGGGTMFYNQGANRVESEVYGENMRGTVARLGNGEQLRTYHFMTYVELPRCGQMIDGMYITNVATEYERSFIKCTLTLTPHFNRLAQYLGTFTEFRLYDVSERQCASRYVNYGTDVILGARESDGGIIPVEGKTEFINTLSPNTVDEGQITCVYAWGSSDGVDDNGNSIEENHTCVLLPCSSFALGNSLAFTFEYADNYSAGYKSSDSGESAKRIKQAVPYGNVYGEFQYLNLRFHSSADGVNPHDLPQVSGVPGGGAILSFSGNKALVIEKDSREKPNITLQMHIRANQKSVVIGSRLAQNNGLVTNSVDNANRPVMYLLKDRLLQFNDFVDTADAKPIDYALSVNSEATENYIVFNADTIGYKSWAIVDPRENRLYVGKNLDDIVDGEDPNKLYISFVGGGQ